jgi:hypothetical protein
MADKTIELRHYPKADPNGLVFNRVWQLVQSGTSDPVEYEVVEAYLDIIADDKAKASFRLGNGLTWDAEAKTVAIKIKNSDAAFIKADVEMAYSFYVEWSHGALQTLREGTVAAVRVA